MQLSSKKELKYLKIERALKQNLKKLESVEKSYHHWGRTASGNSDDYDILRAELNKAEQNVIKSSRHFLQCLDDAKIEF